MTHCRPERPVSRSAAIAVSAVLTTAMSSISIAVAAQTTASVQRCVAVIAWPGSGAELRRMVVGEAQERARGTARERAHGVGRAGHQPGPLGAEERDDGIGDERRHAGVAHAFAGDVVGHVGELDRPPERQREVLRDLLERDRLRPGQRIRPPVVALAGQRRGRRLTDVKRVDERDLRGGGGREQRVHVLDRPGVLEQVGHVGARAQQRPCHAGALQVRLDLAVPVVEHQRRVDRGRRARELDHALDPGRGGGVDRRAFVLDLGGSVPAGQEQAVDAAQRALERIVVAVVADGELDVLAEHVGRASRSRTNARTATPRSRSARTTCAPTVPVAPVTSTFIGFLPRWAGCWRWNGRRCPGRSGP